MENEESGKILSKKETERRPLACGSSQGKRPYETPGLIVLGAVREVTQTPPPILDCSGIACNE
jgi:hypothetical protein